MDETTSLPADQPRKWWLRALFMLVMAVAFHLVACVLVRTALVQLVLLRPPASRRAIAFFRAALGRYLAQIAELVPSPPSKCPSRSATGRQARQRSSGLSIHRPTAGQTRARATAGQRPDLRRPHEQFDADNRDRKADAVAEREHAADHGRRCILCRQRGELRRIADHHDPPDEQPRENSRQRRSQSKRRTQTTHRAGGQLEIRHTRAAECAATGMPPTTQPAARPNRPEGAPRSRPRPPVREADHQRHQHEERVQLPHVAEVAAGRCAKRRSFRKARTTAEGSKRAALARMGSLGHEQQHQQAPAAARIDSVTATACQGRPPPERPRTRCGSAVPRTSAPTRKPRAPPRPSRYQLAAIFMPTG